MYNGSSRHGGFHESMVYIGSRSFDGIDRNNDDVPDGLHRIELNTYLPGSRDWQAFLLPGLSITGTFLYTRARNQ
jgi:hypothetical protein